jgi:hypothetical protein
LVQCYDFASILDTLKIAENAENRRKSLKIAENAENRRKSLKIAENASNLVSKCMN